MNTDDKNVGISIVGLLKALWRGAFFICGMALLLSIVTLAYVILFPERQYSTNAVLMVEADKMTAAGGVLLVLPRVPLAKVASEVERLQSQPLLEKLIAQTSLNENPLIVGEEPEDAEAANFAAMEYLRDALIIEPREGTNLIDMELTAPSADIAYQVVRQLIDIYLLDQARRTLPAKDVTEDWTEDRLAEVAAYLEFKKSGTAASTDPDQAKQTVQMAETAASAAMALFGQELSRLEIHTGKLMTLGLTKLFSEVVSPPVYPEKPHPTGRAATVILAFLLGGSIATLWIVYKHIHRRQIRSEEDIRDVFSYPIWTTVPASAQGGERLTQSMRDLRSALLLNNPDDARAPIIQLTPVAETGNELALSKALGASFSNVGRRSLLIDMRIGADQTQGLRQVVEGHAALDKSVTPLSAEAKGCDVLTSGIADLNDADVLSTPAFSAFLDSVAETYDVILILVSPTLSPADAQLISQRADKIAVLAQLEQVSASDIQDACDTLNAAGTETGFVLLKA